MTASATRTFVCSLSTRRQVACAIVGVTGLPSDMAIPAALRSPQTWSHGSKPPPDASVLRSSSQWSRNHQYNGDCCWGRATQAAALDRADGVRGRERATPSILSSSMLISGGSMPREDESSRWREFVLEKSREQNFFGGNPKNGETPCARLALAQRYLRAETGETILTRWSGDCQIMFRGLSPNVQQKSRRGSHTDQCTSSAVRARADLPPPAAGQAEARTLRA
ncbi:hypothetical protein M2322_004151 [Rhodoblastus acidophilus]|nr:hypothetical protein [Rhodoblastus acidophilus]